MRSLDDHGRKFTVVKLAVYFQGLVVASAYLAALIAGLDDLNLVIIASAAGAVAGLAAAYAGANAWHRQAEARVQAAQVEAGIELPEE